MMVHTFSFRTLEAKVGMSPSLRLAKFQDSQDCMVKPCVKEEKKKKRNIIGNPLAHETGNLCEFKASLVFIASSRTARTTE